VSHSRDEHASDEDCVHGVRALAAALEAVPLDLWREKLGDEDLLVLLSTFKSDRRSFIRAASSLDIALKNEIRKYYSKQGISAVNDDILLHFVVSRLRAPADVDADTLLSWLLPTSGQGASQSFIDREEQIVTQASIQEFAAGYLESLSSLQRSIVRLRDFLGGARSGPPVAS
jgi:hypothetical protein